ncbi:WD40-repeat-containing domain protein [Obelidium mucronatum]|nr:WD40-repeat-containing domain protein [Obelidium mucronatum]
MRICAYFDKVFLIEGDMQIVGSKTQPPITTSPSTTGGDQTPTDNPTPKPQEQTPDLAAAAGTVVVAAVASEKDIAVAHQTSDPEPTLQDFMDKSRLSKLSKTSLSLVSHLTRKSSNTNSLQEAVEIVNQLESSLVTLASAKEMLESVLAKAEDVEAIGGLAGGVSKTFESVLNGIEGIAESHPILKITWFIASAGYRLAKTASETETQYQTLIHRFLKSCKEIHRLQSLNTKGIPPETRQLLADGLNAYIDCLADVAILCVEYFEKPANQIATTIINSPNNLLKLQEINTRLDTTQQTLARVKLDGTLEILVSTASNIITVQATTTKTLEATEKILTAVENVHEKLAEAAVEKDLDNLRSHCQYTEIHSVGEIAALSRKRNPRTRGWIIDRMVAAIVDSSSDAVAAKRVVWLRGEAGTGKSVISGCVAAELGNRGVLAASFFCQHDNKLRDCTAALIQTLSYELATKDPNFRKSLVKSLQDSKFKEKTRPTIHDLITLFILNPFTNWPAETPCAIVLDALDELMDHENIGLVLDAFQSLNKPAVKLFVTSRPDVSVSIKGRKQFGIEAFDVESASNKEDIRIFTRDRLQEMTEDLVDVTSQEFENMVEMLSAASNGLFIWITLVLGNVSGAEGFSVSEEDALEVVEDVLGDDESDGKETGKQLLQRLEQSASLDLNSFQGGTILEAKVPLSMDSVTRLVACFPAPDKLAKVRVTKSLKLLQSLLKLDADDKLSFIHKTVREYLVDIHCHSDCSVSSKTCEAHAAAHCCHNQASSTFQIDFNTVSYNLAYACLELLQKETTETPAQSLFQNMARLNTLEKSPTWKSSTLSDSLQYTVTYWSHHFVDAFSHTTSQSQQESLIQSLHRFCKTKLPFYLEALLLLQGGKLNQVFSVVASISDCLARFKTPQSEYITSILNDLKHVAYNFRVELMMNPLQVYRHALVSVPHSTGYYQTYQHLVPAELTIGGGGGTGWGPFTLHGHSEYVATVAISSDSKTIVSGSDDKSIMLWSVETGECVATLLGHTSGVYSIALSQDGKTAVSGSKDCTVKVWDIVMKDGEGTTGECRYTLTGHSKIVTAVAISPDAKLIIRTLEGHSSMVSTVALTQDPTTAVSGSWDESVKVWDLKTGTCEQTFVGHIGMISSVTVSFDGRIIGSGSGDGTVKLWSTQSGGCIRTLTGNDSIINSVQFSFDSQRLVSGGQDKTATLWDVNTGECIQSFQGHSDAIYSVSLAKDGKTLVSASGDQTIKIWNIDSKNSKDTEAAAHHTDRISCIAVSNDGAIAATGSWDNSIRMWSTSTGICLQTFSGHASRVTSVAISGDGKTVVSGSGDMSVKLWVDTSPDCVQTFSGHMIEPSNYGIAKVEAVSERLKAIMGKYSV